MAKDCDDVSRTAVVESDICAVQW